MGPGEVVPAGGDGHGWGRSVRGRGVGGGGGVGPGRAVRRALPPARSHLCGRGSPPGARSGDPCPCTVLHAGRTRGRRFRSPARLLLSDAGPPTRGWERQPLPHRGCRPSEPPELRPRRERGPRPELRSRPRSSFVYPTAPCCGRRGC